MTFFSTVLRISFLGLAIITVTGCDPKTADPELSVYPADPKVESVFTAAKEFSLGKKEDTDVEAAFIVLNNDQLNKLAAKRDGTTTFTFLIASGKASLKTEYIL